MIAHAPSALSLAGAGFYLVVAAASAMAARQAAVEQQVRTLRRSWQFVAAIFVLFAGMRLLAVEDLLRALLREELAIHHLTEGRREFQLPLSLAALAGGAAIGLGMLCRIIRRGPTSAMAAIEWARLAIAGMVALIALRLISFHSVDQVLFAPAIGSVRINWMLDLGLSVIALVAATHFIRRAHARRNAASN